eukprot:SAG31_NODE_3786_length_3882_cov_2.127941_2_plen_314_part_00
MAQEQSLRSGVTDSTGREGVSGRGAALTSAQEQEKQLLAELEQKQRQIDLLQQQLAAHSAAAAREGDTSAAQHVKSDGHVAAAEGTELDQHDVQAMSAAQQPSQNRRRAPDQDPDRSVERSSQQPPFLDAAGQEEPDRMRGQQQHLHHLQEEQERLLRYEQQLQEQASNMQQSQYTRVQPQPQYTTIGQQIPRHREEQRVVQQRAQPRQIQSTNPDPHLQGPAEQVADVGPQTQHTEGAQRRHATVGRQPDQHVDVEPQQHSSSASRSGHAGESELKQITVRVVTFSFFVPTIREIRYFYREMQRTNRESAIL